MPVGWDTRTKWVAAARSSGTDQEHEKEGRLAYQRRDANDRCCHTTVLLRLMLSYVTAQSSSGFRSDSTSLESRLALPKPGTQWRLCERQKRYRLICCPVGTVPVLGCADEDIDRSRRGNSCYHQGARGFQARLQDKNRSSTPVPRWPGTDLRRIMRMIQCCIIREFACCGRSPSSSI